MVVLELPRNGQTIVDVNSSAAGNELITRAKRGIHRLNSARRNLQSNRHNCLIKIGQTGTGPITSPKHSVRGAPNRKVFLGIGVTARALDSEYCEISTSPFDLHTDPTQRLCWPRTSRDQLFDDMSVDVCQSVITARVTIGLASVIKTQPQNCGVEVVHVHAVLHHGRDQFVNERPCLWRWAVRLSAGRVIRRLATAR